jgi:hypothetical protein
MFSLSLSFPIPPPKSPRSGPLSRVPFPVPHSNSSCSGVKGEICRGQIMNAVSILRDCVGEVREGRGTFPHSPLALAKGLKSIPAINSIHYQYRENGGLSLPQVYHATRNHRATDPRDKLYAMLRLLPPEDQANALLKPD